MQLAKREPMTVSGIKERAPSVYAKHASNKMSESYTFIPTTQIIESLNKTGLVVVEARQRSARANSDVARHLVRFAFKDQLSKIKPDGLLEEVVMVNSHNGRAAFKLYYGLFRLICGNGLVVSDATVGMARRHIGDLKAVMDEVDNILDQGPKVIKLVKSMRQHKMTDSQRLKLAQDAMALRYEEKEVRGQPKVKPTIIADQLLIPRRVQDKSTDLWTTYNVIQENLTAGGITGKSANGRATHTRELQDVRKLVSVNTGLWDLAAKMVA